jgi:hypothetical protein
MRPAHVLPHWRIARNPHILAVTETEGFEMPKTKSRAKAKVAAIQTDTARVAAWLAAGALVIGALIAKSF